MKTTELEDELCKWIDAAILKANKGEEICECGQVILDRDKTSAVLNEVVEVALTRFAAFIIVAEDHDVRLHLPDPNGYAKSATHLH